MQIGTVTLTCNLVFAPLAGISNLPLRLLAKESGCGLVYSEMVSANGLVYGAAKTHQLMNSTPAEKPLAIQLFGSDPAIMADAAQIAAAAGADIVDINFGCAVKKIVKTGAGVALMRTPERAAALLRAVRDAIRIPLTIKIRSGWDRGGEQAFNLVRIAAECGVDALAVHPRSAAQGFRGRADWSLIAAIKKTTALPVIGNGDVEQAEDAVRMLQETGCDAVMIGRAAIGNPFIFAETLDLLAGRRRQPTDSHARLRIMRRYAADSVSYLGERPACLMMRSRLGWFVKGLHGCSAFRESIKKLESLDQVMEKIDAYEKVLTEARRH
ncbi:MAG: tRNA dihydrouridine synthase DusB [Desulfobacterales bacterium]|nr:tRNA dihydrouridine synthase DusB [Desulfobacterales bacterium]MDJ0989157.1 tRNA dihydrouridine synthase DusB [Desulfobacterales bacterium]